VPKAAAATPRSEAGKALKRWATALDISTEDVLDFLEHFQLVMTDNEASWREQTKPWMRLAGLRDDDSAVRVGVDIVREWVKNGAGPRTPDHIRKAAADAGLLADSGRLVLAVHAIDDKASTNLPTKQFDWVELFEGDSGRTRRVLKDPDGWSALTAQLAAAEKDLGGFGVRRLLVEGAMRLPLWFTVGATFPDVRGWELQVEQRDDLWTTASAPAQSQDEAVLLGKPQTLPGGSTDVAVVIALTHDATPDVVRDVSAHNLAGTLISLTTRTGPGQDSVRDGVHARTWSRSARELLREELRKLAQPPSGLHLFIAAPAGAALLLGHDWNLLPETVVYELVDNHYVPTVTVR
jgi:hypothetical protein